MTTRTLPNGTTLQDGKYTIESVLGTGGTCYTYKAFIEQEVTGELGSIKSKVPIAVKEFFMKDECLRSADTKNVIVPNTNSTQKIEQYKRCFKKEASKLSKISHPNIVHVVSIFEENDTIYYAMEYIPGGSLKELLEKQGPLPEERVIRYSTQIASALCYLHRNNMCHYDLKPGNIMLWDDNKAMLIDFGIAKNYDEYGNETSTTPPGLTKGFAPLEQYSSVSEFSPKIDVYGLGATMYTLLTGQRAPEPMHMINKPFMAKPPQVSDHLWRMIEKSMAMAPEDRPSMEELLHMLSNETYTGDTILDSEKDPTPPPYVATTTGQKNAETVRPDNRTIQTPNPKPKKKKGFYLLLLLVAIAVGVLCYFLISNNRNTSADIAITDTDTTDVTSDEEHAIYDENGNVIKTFTGQIVKGKPEGYGTLTYKKEDAIHTKYVGHMKNGLRQSDDAILYYKNGDVFKGSFTDDHFNKGTYTIKETGDYFDGSFKNDSPWEGVWYDKNDKPIRRVENGVEY